VRAEHFLRDFRYGARTLAKNPGFAAIIVLTVALSIGATSAIFSMIHGVLLRPLPYPDADRIVRIFYQNPNFPKFPMNHFDLRDFRAWSRSFEGLAAYTHSDLQLSGVGDPVRLAGFRVTAGFFQVLGLRPARGREFTANDELPGNNNQVILSDRVWRARFGGAEDILGRKIMLDARPFTVIGVMPPGTEHPGNAYNALAYGDSVEIWWPFTFGNNSNARGSHFVDGIGRLKPGVSPEQAEAELNAMMQQLARQHPAARGWNIFLNRLDQEIVGNSRRLLLVLLGAVGLVLLIACVNAANLMLARATSRQREIALRSALGAGRARLIGQMLAESLLIALLGGTLGTLFAAGGLKALMTLLPEGFPRSSDIHLDWTIFGFTLAISVATGLLFGFAPAIRSSRTDLQHALREGGRGATSSVYHVRMRSVLVVGEVALACMLLIGAGLLLRSFARLLRVDPGFRAQHVLTASVALPGTAYPGAADTARFFERLAAELTSLPSVEAAGAGTDLPWTGYDDNWGGIRIEGNPPAANESTHARYHVASPEYFRSVGIPLIGGRFFNEHDRADAPLAVIINAAMARKYLPNQNAVGKRLDFGTSRNPQWTTVVGVVGDVKDRPDSASTEPAFWWPVTQTPMRFGQMAVVVRAAADPSLLANHVRAAVRKLDPNLAVANVRLMDEIAEGSFATHRFTLFLVGLFAALALALAAAGIYGVISYSVNQRMHEFAMRMALGARGWDVMRLVLGHGMKIAAAGVILGLASAAALARVMRSLLYEVSGTDPVTFAGVALMAIAIAALACYVPARRATSADPMTALRAE